jgi:hypothetical protein
MKTLFWYLFGRSEEEGNISIKTVISNHHSNWVLAGIDVRVTIPSPQYLKRKQQTWGLLEAD